MPPTAPASCSNELDGRRHRQRHQGAAAGRGERPLPQGPLRHRPGRPGPSPARPGVTVPIRASGRDRHAGAGQVRRGVPHLPAGRPVHHRQRTAARSPSARTRPSWPPPAPARPDPAWQADYRATRPKVERKIGHLMRRRHGGRRARVRGQAKVAADFALLAAAVNLARLAVLDVSGNNGTRATASA